MWLQQMLAIDAHEQEIHEAEAHVRLVEAVTVGSRSKEQQWTTYLDGWRTAITRATQRGHQPPTAATPQTMVSRLLHDPYLKDLVLRIQRQLEPVQKEAPVPVASTPASPTHAPASDTPVTPVTRVTRRRPRAV